MSDQQQQESSFTFAAASPADQQKQQQQRQRRLSPTHVGSAPEISTLAASAPAEPAPPAPPADEQPAPKTPPFEPLFTLLTNTTTNATVHPRVHYLFTDDDTSVLAAPHDPSHRTLLVDLAGPSGSSAHSGCPWSISWAASLSPDFAITGSRISAQQPDNTDSDGDGSGGAAGSLMLRVEGVEREPVDAQGQTQGQGQAQDMAVSASSGHEDTEALAEEFRRRMGVLKRVVNEGEKRRQWLQAKEDQEQRDEQGEGEEHREGGKIAEDRASGSAATPAMATEVVDMQLGNLG